MIRTVMLAVIISLSLVGVASAQGFEGPCGPKGQLPSELSHNVGNEARCFELRMYTVDQSRVGQGDFNGDINMLHQRFREQEVAIFEKHGAEVVAVWQDLQKPDTLVWMLAYRDWEHRQEVWSKFREDPDWDALLAKYNVPIQRPVVSYMSTTDYSHLK